MPFRTLSLAAALGAFGCIVPLPAQPESGQTSQRNAHESKLSGADQKLLARLAQAYRTEIQLGELVGARAGSAALKSHGAQALKEHRDLQQALQAFAEKRGTDLAGSPQAQQGAAASELAGLEGAEFDKRSLALAARAHSQALSALKEIERTTWDAQLRRLAVQQSAVESRHLVAAQRIANGAPNAPPARR